jgi:hypothetical protein
MLLVKVIGPFIMMKKDPHLSLDDIKIFKIDNFGFNWTAYEVV